MRPTPSVKLIALVLLFYGSYTAWLMVSYPSVWFLLWTVPCIAGGVGLLMSRAWSQYVFYSLVFCTIAGWAGFVALSWPKLAQPAIFKLLALGVGLVLFSVWSGVVVFRHFRRHGAQI